MVVQVRPLVPYYRVSTDKQGESGLGLEAQQAAVKRLAKERGAPIIGPEFYREVKDKSGNVHVLKGRGYLEVETGKYAERPDLNMAVLHAKRGGATLCIAKLDRLARNVAFTATLLREGVDFVCCDNQHANRLTIHILASIAEHEAEQISDRTKNALRQLKERGVMLGAARPGWPNPVNAEPQERTEARKLAIQKGVQRGALTSARLRSERAKVAKSEMLPVIAPLLNKGLTLQQIADELNRQGWQTPKKAAWTKMAVWKYLKATGLTTR